MVVRWYPAVKKAWVAASRMRASVRRRCSVRDRAGSNWPPFSATIFCSSPSQSPSTGARRTA
jgi:hypothetical protein